MAKRIRKASAEIKNDQVAYFFLMKQTEQGARQRARDKEQGQSEVTRAVKAEGGACTLFSTRGGDYDYVSVMTGLSPAAAVRIAATIESRGTVRARLIVGAHIAGQISV